MMLLNGAVFFHTWHITHFCEADNRAFVPPDKMNFNTKVGALFTGIYNPKSKDDSLPAVPYQVVPLTANGHNLEAWDIPADGNNGTVLILHGFKGSKSSMMPITEYFHAQGMNTFVLDFSGHGNSDGYCSTLGYYEAKEVAVAYDYVKAHHTGPTIIFGSSMGAVAALRAASQYGINPDKMILEAPFGSMLQATRNRFVMQNAPTFPLAEMITFWGSAQNNFWAFNHCPTEYAKQVKLPVLMLYGANDQKVSLPEIEAIYANLPAEKSLHIFKQSGHCSFLQTEPDEWKNAISSFLASPALAISK